MQPSSNGCPTSRSDGDVVRHDPRGLSVCTCRRSTYCKVQLKKPASESMGRTEANEKHRPTALKRGAGGGTRLAQLFQLQINGRRSVSPIARRIKPKRNDVLKRSTTSPSVQSATPPSSVHCDHSIALRREHHSEAAVVCHRSQAATVRRKLIGDNRAIAPSRVRRPRPRPHRHSVFHRAT